MADYFVNIVSGELPIDLTWSVGGPVTNGTVTVKLWELNGPNNNALDWADLTFKAAGHTTLNLPLPHQGAGLYQEPTQEALLLSATSGMSSGVTILRATYSGTAGGQEDLTEFDNFSMIVGGSVTPAVQPSSDVFDLLNVGIVQSAMREVVTYTPQGNPVLTVAVVIDRESPVENIEGGNIILVPTPTLEMRKADWPEGQFPQKGDTLQTTQGEVFTVSQTPHDTGRGWWMMVLRK